MRWREKQLIYKYKKEHEPPLNKEPVEKNDNFILNTYFLFSRRNISSLLEWEKKTPSITLSRLHYNV